MLRVSLKCAAVLLLCSSLFSHADTTPRIPRVTRPPKLADFLNGTPREAELAITDFTQYEPTEGAEAAQKTTAYLSYDAENLYVAWICKDDPAKIRARISRRKDIGDDDRVTINIDTFHDHKHGFWFDVNPYGIQADGRTTDGQGDDNNFETLWYTDAKLTDDGYIVLQKIPFRSLRFPGTPAQSWGIALGRHIARNGEWDWWPRFSRSRSSQWVGQFQDVTIEERIAPGRNIQFIPYGLFSNARSLNHAGFRTDTEFHGGLDTKMVIRNSIAFDFTLNPDFSQVESDEPRATANERYEVTYPEKRLFFMENAQLFDTPEQLFFSRRIIDPQYGARMTGTLGRWVIGVLGADDRAPGKQLAADDPLHNTRATNVVLRAEREFGKQSHFGTTMTSREFGPASNRVASFDTRLGLGGNWFLRGQATSTNTRFRDGSTLAGPAYFAKLSNSGEHFDFSSAYTDRSPGYRAQLGYASRVDMRESGNWFSYRWRPKKGALVNFGPSIWQSVNWDRAGRVQDWQVAPQFGFEFRQLTNVTLSRTESFELYQNLGFRKNESKIEFNTEPNRWLSVNSEFSLGKAINYYPSATLQPFLTHATYLSHGVTLRPQVRLRLDESYIYNQLDSDPVWMPAGARATGAVFNNHIIRSKANYQFTPALSIRTIVDYNGLLPNSELVNQERSKLIGTDVLLAYVLHPGTALYVGYSDTLENLAPDPLLSSSYVRSQFPGTLTNRQFFMKLSYLFRY